MRHPGHRNNWIRGHRLDVARIKRADVRQVGLALCDAMVEWNGGEGPLPEIELIRTALRQGSRVLNEVAAVALALSLRGHGNAAATLTQVFRTVPAEARASLLGWGRSNLQREEQVDFMRMALQDRSSLVRLNAASTAAAWRLAELAPMIEALREREKQANAREFLVMCASLARFGYWVESEDEDGVEMTVDGEGHRTWLTVPRCAVDEYGVEGVAKIIQTHTVGPYPWDRDEGRSAE